MKTIIIGAGISGLSLAFELMEQGVSKDSLLVLESTDSVGGKICQIGNQDYLIEGGPNGFLDNKPEIMDLCNRLGLKDQILPADIRSKKRYIFYNQTLHQIPESPIHLFKSKLFTCKGKFRFLWEYWVPSQKVDEEESIAMFTKRRLGKEVYEKLIDPMISGIFAGNPEYLSLKAAFPRMWELEREYGSLIKAIIKIAREKKKSGVKQKNTIGGNLSSFPKGMNQLMNALKEKIEPSIHCNEKVENIQQYGKQWNITTKKQLYVADRLILATSSYESANLLANISPRISEELKSIIHVHAIVVGLVYEKTSFSHSLDGFGYLIPSSEKSDILGCLWSSSIYPKMRTTKNTVLLRVIMGGARFPECISLSDEEIIKKVTTSLKQHMNIHEQPIYTTIKKWKNAIPQYYKGHLKKIEQIQNHLKDFPNLYLTGNSYQGISVADCVKQSQKLSQQILSK